ncbi:MAG: GDP-mannose 4,6-dehydratase, partial [Rhodospirillales bacterium]|nr:GDP-mannose 4,6-dehydratase [Rhodospirillales bacterium]
EVVAIDNLNDYYEVTLKKARLDQLSSQSGFTFYQLDIADQSGMEKLVADHPEITGVLHMAAQAGVRYSLENPMAYAETNLQGQVQLLEVCRRLKKMEHFVFASSSSVYGGRKDLPFSVEDRTDKPVSLYATTKRSGELMCYSYAHLYDMPVTALRFFTVYGPWGRPDMAYYMFTRDVLAGKPINVFNNGEMRRDFTYIDDVTRGVLSCLKSPPQRDQDDAPFAMYNIGNNRSENLMDFIAVIEKETGKKAEIDFQPMQPGDVKETFADIESAKQDFGFDPVTGIAEGLPNFIKWYRDYYDT